MVEERKEVACGGTDVSVFMTSRAVIAILVARAYIKKKNI